MLDIWLLWRGHIFCKNILALYTEFRYHKVASRSTSWLVTLNPPKNFQTVYEGEINAYVLYVTFEQKDQIEIVHGILLTTLNYL